MGIADLFRPKHRHSNVDKRADAVRNLSSDELDVVIDIARRDPEPSIRRIALGKIDDPAILVELAGDEDERSVRELARRRASDIWLTRAATAEEPDDAREAIDGLVGLGDQHAMADLASRAHLVDVRDAALASLDDPKALAELARNPNTHVAARTTAIARISDVEVLRSIAVDERRKDIALAAFERIDDDEVLDAVASKAKNKAVRSRARKRLAELKKDRDKAPASSVEDKRRHAERVQLVRLAESLARGQEFTASAAEMERIEAAFQALEPAADNDLGALGARFSRARERYDRRLRAHRARQAEKARAGAEDESQTTPEAPGEALPDVPADAPVDAPADAPVDALAGHASDTSEGQDSRSGDAAADDERKAAGQPAGDSGGQAELADEAAQVEDADKRREERERKKRERREQALATVAELTAELREGIALSRRKPAEKLLQKVDKAFGSLSVGGGTDDGPVAEFKRARHAMFLRVQELRDAFGWKQWANIAQQEALIAQAEELLASEDDNELSSRLKALQAAWKAVGPAPRKKSQELWERFKSTCDQVYDRVKARRARQGEIHAANLTRKLELCERVEALAESTDWDNTAEEIKALQREWKAIGPVPRKKSDAVWKRFRAACDLFFERRQPYMEQQMAEWEANLAKKQALCEQAEALAGSTDWKDTAAALRQMQRDWRDVGLVPRKDANAINKRFRAACDEFFNRRKEFVAQQKAERQQALEALEAEIATLADVATGAAPAPPAADAPDVRARALAVRASLRELSPEGKTRQKLYGLSNRLFLVMLERDGDVFQGSELDPTSSRQKKHKILARAEEIAPRAQPSTTTGDARTPEQMAERLRTALAENALSSALANSTDGRNLADTVAEIEAAWVAIGPVPGEEGQELEDRFHSACERARRSAGVQKE